MNYKEINKALLEGRDVDGRIVEKTADFYRYLLNNKVAYYYSKYLSHHSNETEQKIIERGQAFDDRFKMTLKLVSKLCAAEGIPFMLFKTRRYIPEPVDGDIDLLVRKADFGRFLEAFRGQGFDAVEDEPEKGKCEKDGYCIVEPHVNISWRTGVFLREDEIWGDPRTVTIDGLQVQNCSPALEVRAIVGEAFFSPEYIDLHRILALQRIVESAPEIEAALPEMELRYLEQARLIMSQPDVLLPYFFNSLTLQKFLSKKSLPAQELGEVLFKNFCWKYRYRYIRKLPFTHDWKIL